MVWLLLCIPICVIFFLDTEENFLPPPPQIKQGISLKNRETPR